MHQVANSPELPNLSELANLFQVVQRNSRQSPQTCALLKHIRQKPIHKNPLLIAWKKSNIKTQSAITPLFYSVYDLGEIGRRFGYAVPSAPALQYLVKLRQSFVNVVCVNDVGYWGAQLLNRGCVLSAIGPQRALLATAQCARETSALQTYLKHVLLLVTPDIDELFNTLVDYNGRHLVLICDDHTRAHISDWQTVKCIGLPNFPGSMFKLWHLHRKVRSSK